MEFSDILVKMAKNENLTPQELDFLRIQGKDTQRRNAQLSGLTNADGSLDLIRSRISNPFFATGALSLLNATRTTDTAITTGTDTAVEFETIVSVSESFECDLTDPGKIRIIYPGQFFAIMGKVAWASDATGYRNVKLEAFDANKASLGLDPLISNAGWAGTDNIFPFNICVAASPDMAYFGFTVGHTKGSNLNLLSFGVSVFIV